MSLESSKRLKWDEFVHLHDDKILDRNLLTRRQHEDLLATPRPMFGPAPTYPRGKKLSCKIPKICPPRIDQLALPTVKAMEGVLELFNQTLEPMRIVRLIKLIHTKEIERPIHSNKPKKKKPSEKKKKKAKRKECLKIWLKKQLRKSSGLVLIAIRERKAATLNYRQLLVALGLMKVMKIKKKKNLPRFTKQYLMKICEQLAVICDTELTPYKKIPEIVPAKTVESVVSKRHIFWKFRPIEEEEEELEVEEETEEEEGVVTALITIEEFEPKEERVGIKQQMPSITEMSEESFYEEFEPELDEEMESYDEDKEGGFTTDEDHAEKQEGEEEIQDEGEAPREETVQGEEEALDEAALQVKEEEKDEAEVKEEIPAEETLGDEEDEGGDKEEIPIEEKPEGEDKEEIPAEEKIEGKEEDHTEDEGERAADVQGQKEDEKAVEEEEGKEAPTTEDITDDIEGGVKSEGGAITEEGESDTVAPEDTEFEPTAETDEEGATEIEGEIKLEVKEEIMEEEVEEEEGKGEGEEEEEEGKGEEEEEGKVEGEEEEEEEKGKGEDEEVVEKKRKEKKPKKPEKEKKIKVEVEAPPTEVTEEHPPNTVSYLSWNIYSHWLEEFGRNIQTYGKCLNKFKAILEAGSDVQADKIGTILVNWGTYLKESMKFEENMALYFEGKKMTKCAKCGDYTLYNIPEDHEVPDELKQAATSTGRWKKLLEEAEELCRSFSFVTEDTISLVSHESVDIIDSSIVTSETSMYVVEDYFPSRR